MRTREDLSNQKIIYSHTGGRQINQLHSEKGAKEGFNRRIWVVGVALALFLSFIPIIIEIIPTVEAPAILEVDDSGGKPYTSIQAAVDDAQPGDTVFVYSGIYYENIIINKTISLIGEDRNTTIIDGNGIGYVVRFMNADYINLSDFGIRNGEEGIRIDSGTSYNNNISWNHVYDIFSTNNVVGIQGGNFNNFYYNIVNNISSNGSFKSAEGMSTALSCNVFFNQVYNVFSNSSRAIGIAVRDFCNVSHNIIVNISSNGINYYSAGFLIDSLNSNITHNSISNISSTNTDTSALGIYLFSASGNNVLNNIILNITSLNYVSKGIFLEDSSNNYVYNNDIFNLNSSWGGCMGFDLSNSNDNRFISNHIYNISTTYGSAFGIHFTNSLRGYLELNHIHSFKANGNAIGVRWATSSSENWNITSNWFYDLISFNDYLDFVRFTVLTHQHYVNHSDLLIL